MSTDNNEQELQELRRRIKRIEGMFAERLLDRELAHQQARNKDARTRIAPGQIELVEIQRVPRPNNTLDDPLAKVNGVTVFINTDEPLEVGELIEVKITETRNSSAQAKPCDI